MSYCQSCADYEDEVKRLREALERIKRGTFTTPNHWASDVARAALAPEEEE